jgi:hypothetical protein
MFGQRCPKNLTTGTARQDQGRQPGTEQLLPPSLLIEFKPFPVV